MSLLKSKQINIPDLINYMATEILANPSYRSLWASIVSNVFLSHVFSVSNSNITIGQNIFVVTYANTPLEVIVYRNGLKLINLVDYVLTTGSGNFTITLTIPVNASSGAIFSETIEINYY